jgi:DNA-directed RNA polymerase subunit B"
VKNFAMSVELSTGVEDDESIKKILREAGVQPLGRVV